MHEYITVLHKCRVTVRQLGTRCTVAGGGNGFPNVESYAAWPIYVVNPLLLCASGPAVLIGDAAHEWVVVRLSRRTLLPSSNFIRSFGLVQLYRPLSTTSTTCPHKYYSASRLLRKFTYAHLKQPGCRTVLMKILPDFNGPITPEESARMQLEVINQWKVEDSGSFVSRFGNKEWWLNCRKFEGALKIDAPVEHVLSLSSEASRTVAALSLKLLGARSRLTRLDGFMIDGHRLIPMVQFH
ncbi:hypothetical protein C8F04DRAFT_1313425 [Mycena alexandri]|uniref:Uncharacterized protein n=1 Tax=Mycena alexandri TaxID=1745969 RepID=A0AAD6S6R6_9AGAR|nr:hypothetical protein C8F04DRAFT_1313425 [Mycena alexandri]